MPGPRGVITVNGNMERSLRTEKDTAALAAEVQNGLFKPNRSSVVKTADTAKLVRRPLQRDSSDKSELNYQLRPHRLPHKAISYVPRVHEYILKIPWAVLGAHCITTVHSSV